MNDGAADLTLASVKSTGAGSDVVISSEGSINVASVQSTLSGRVTLATDGNLFAVTPTSGTVNISAGLIELRAGGDGSSTSGKIGTTTSPLAISLPVSTSATVLAFTPSSGAGSTPRFAPQITDVLPYQLYTELFTGKPTGLFLTAGPQAQIGIAPSTTALDEASVDLGISLTALTSALASNAGLTSATDVNSVTGEGILYIDWASFNPDVSLYGTVNPPVRLPADQSEEDDSKTAAWFARPSRWGNVISQNGVRRVPLFAN
jgi:hypothetical protein